MKRTITINNAACPRCDKPYTMHIVLEIDGVRILPHKIDPCPTCCERRKLEILNLHRKKRWIYSALSQKILAVATEDDIGTWAAYVGIVPGNCHDEEWPSVLNDGTKMREREARAMFPQFADLPWRR